MARSTTRRSRPKRKSKTSKQGREGRASESEPLWDGEIDVGDQPDFGDSPESPRNDPPQRDRPTRDQPKADRPQKENARNRSSRSGERFREHDADRDRNRGDTGNKSSAKAKNKFTYGKGIKLSKEMVTKIRAGAKRFYDATGKSIRITSGVRSARGQASAMHAFFQNGNSYKEYSNKAAAKQIFEAFNATNKSASIKAMTEVIEQQMQEGTYISDHLSGRAFDASIAGLTVAEQEMLTRIFRDQGAEAFVHGKPRHLHVEYGGRP